MIINEKPTLRLGICMAGAVSAGAYTAGVLDYLFEALDEWEKAKALNLPGVPRHQVRIEVLSGASAGGMTAAIASAALQTQFPPINQKNHTDYHLNQQNPFYHSWVNLSETPESDMMQQMLQTDDIVNDPKGNAHQEVRAGFNSSFIDTIAYRALGHTVKDPNIKRPYLATDFEFLTTLNNLRGYEYNLKFITEQGRREHRMKMHRDFAHFQYNASEAYGDDGKIPFHFNDKEGCNRDLLINTAMATGAFPVGLAPRVLQRDAKYINDSPLLRIDNNNTTLVDPLHPYVNVNVDGGAINNEPFDLTEQILINRRKSDIKNEVFANLPTSGLNNADRNNVIEAALKSADAYVQEVAPSSFDTTVIMIDPFPNFNEIPNGNYLPLKALKFAAPDILGAMREQLMLKVDQIKTTYSDNDYSRFMIAPIRKKNGVQQLYSIACGSFGGFGGFFSKAFREHDYMLGRRNCQRFIQRYLCVPMDEKNLILVFGYEGMEQAYRFESANQKYYLPLIPDIRVKTEANGTVTVVTPSEEIEFAYPKVKLSYLLSLRKPLMNRFSALVDNLTNGKDPLREEEISPVLQRIRKRSFLQNLLLHRFLKTATHLYLSIGKFFGRGAAADYFLDAVIDDMEKRELLEEDV